MLTIGQIFIRLFIAAILSGVLGLERNFKYTPVVLHQNMLLGVGAALAMILSLKFENDPGQIAASVIIAIGFLAAAVVIKNQDENQSISRAIMVLLAGIIGLTIGLGYYSAGVLTVAGALTINYFFNVSGDKKVVKLDIRK